MLERGAGRLEPLAASCLVEGYVHDNTTGPSFPAARLVRSLRDVDRILLEGSAPGIRASGVAVTPSSRRVAPLWFARTFGSRHLVVWNRAGVLGKEFYRLFPPEAARTISLAAQLNGTLTILQREILGLANLGDGALKFSTDEIRRILWLPELPSAVLAPLFLPLAGRVMGTLPAELDQPDRRKMDALIFDALGLNPKEQAAVYQGVRELVGTRLRKAASRGR